MPGFVITSSGAWRKAYDFQAQVGNAWRRVDRAYVVGSDGQWHLFHQFVANINTQIDITSTSGLTITNAPNEAYTVTGVMRNADTGSPLPGGLTVKLQMNSSTQYATTTTAADGSFALSYKPTKVGGYSPYVQFETQGVYQASSWSEGRLQVSSPLNLTTSWPSNLILGKSSSWPGTVQSATGEYPSGASVQLFRVANGTASMVASTTANSVGDYGISWTPNEGSHGNYDYYVKVVPTNTALFPTTWGPYHPVSGYQPTPATVSQSVNQISNTSVKIEIKDQAYVDHFVCRCTETGNVVQVSSSGTAGASLYASWTLSEDTNYHFVTTAYSDNPTDNNTGSNTISVTTGHAAQTDSGSGVFAFNCVDSASWRSADGWSYLGTKLGQGFYSTGSPYYGVAAFNNEEMANSIATYGGGNHSARVDHLSISKLEVYTDRVSGSGSSSAVNINFYCTPNYPNSGTPTLGSSAMGQVQGPAPGAHEWNTLPSNVNSWFSSILHQGYSLTMYANNSSQYAIYYGTSSFKIRATLSWSYTEVAYKGPTYSNG